MKKKGLIRIAMLLSVLLIAQNGAVLAANNQSKDKIQSAMTVEATSTKLTIGQKNVAVSDILIKENIAGAIQKGANTFDGGTQASSENMFIAIESIAIDTNAPIEVTVEEGGDIIVENARVAETTFAGSSEPVRGIELLVQRESTMPSTIRISGITVTTNRMLPAGNYALRIGGNVAANYSDTNNTQGTFDSPYLVVMQDYIVIEPEKTSDTPDKISVIAKPKPVVKITVDNPIIQKDDMPYETDGAPFIHNNTLMAPVSIVSGALDIPSENIIWEPSDQSVTVINGTNTAKMHVGSEFLLLNDQVITMTCAPMNKNGRVYIPMRVLGEDILGVTVDWDEKSRTATFNGE